MGAGRTKMESLEPRYNEYRARIPAGLSRAKEVVVKQDSPLNGLDRLFKATLPFLEDPFPVDPVKNNGEAAVSCRASGSWP